MGVRNSHNPKVSTLSKSQWLSAFAVLPIERKPPVIDIRSELDFEREHVPYASNFPFSKGEKICSRLNELPAASGQPQFAIVGDPEDCFQVSKQLERKGYPCPIQLNEKDVTGLTLVQGLSRALWSPATILVEELPRLHAHSLRTALDVGCGSGRDAAFLAYAGFSVTAVDRDPKLTDKATRLFSRKQYHPLLPHPCPLGKVETELRTFGANFADDRDFLRTKAAGLLLVVRFLRRGVLELLHEGVQPGGLVIYEHFLHGCERFGSPVKASQMLRRGELREVFSEARNFTVLRDEECTLEDGRPVVRFVAKKGV